LERLFGKVANYDGRWISILLCDLQHQVVVDRDGRWAPRASIATDQSLFDTFSHIALLVVGTDAREVVLTIQNEFVFALPAPEKCRFSALADVIPWIGAVGTNTMVARYRVDRILRVFAFPYLVITFVPSWNSFEILRLETPRYSAGHNLTQDLIV
jgi:hypothetical protein